jgi:hypothetical protein
MTQALTELCQGLPKVLPPACTERDPSVPHAPIKNIDKILSDQDQILAVKNALRFVHNIQLTKKIF